MADNIKSIDTIFCSAIEISDVPSREEYIEKACTNDVELKQKVSRLLDAHFKAGKFLAEVDKTREDFATENLGTVIGPYKLLEPIGEGGMGTVYMADQTEPVKRRVALKLIKAGMDTRQVIARFDAERQALAMMDHPNIAKVFDAGATEAGRPYFVMELVKGLPVTRFCDEQKLPTEARLKLFRQVCQAVQHAHQKGIIHRDLKPSNIMIAMYDDQPVPKVIDFGVAKATGEALTEKTVFTKFGQIVGTLEYMSPEQAQFNQKDIDTRSDIYSLGSILYELLVGEPPFERERLKSQPLDETLRMIRHEEPTIPSTRLSSTAHLAEIASKRELTPGKLNSMVRGELDWIVMKALEKDRSKRYQTANGLERDIQCYLQDEPIEAGPPSAAYRFRKFAKRNRAKLIVASVASVSLLMVGAALTYSTVNGWYQRNTTRIALVDAQREQARLVGLSNFIITGLISSATPDGAGDPEISVHDAMLALEDSLDDSFPENPRLRAWVMGQLGKYLKDLGRYKDARRVLTEAYERLQQTHGERNSATLYIGRELAWTLSHLDLHEDAISLARDIAETATDEYGDVAAVAECWNTLGTTYYRAGRLDESEQAYRTSIAINDRIGDSDAAAIANLGDVFYERGQFDTAERHYLEGLELLRKSKGETHIETMKVLDDLAFLYHSQGQHEKARSSLERLLEQKKKHLGSTHSDTLRTMDILAQVEYRLGDYQRAINLIEKCVDGQLANSGRMTLRYANALHSLAIARRGVNDLAGAYDAAEQAVTIATELVGQEHDDTMLYTFTLMSYLRDLRRWKEAHDCAEKVIAYREQQFKQSPEQSTRLAAAIFFNGLLWHWQGQDDEAIEQYDRAIRLLEKQIESNSHFRVRQYMCDTLRWRSTSLRHLGRFKESIDDANLARTFTESLDQQLDCDLRHAQTLAQTGQTKEAIRIAEDVLSEIDDEGYLLARAAAVYGICLQTSSGGEVVSPGSDQSEMQRYRDRAMQLLKQAADDCEFDDPYSDIQLLENPDFESLLEDEKFRSFLTSLKSMESVD